MEKINSYKDLRIWQKGIDIVENIYVLTNQFPKSEVYGLTSQMRRSAISIPSNVAEGFKRLHKKEFQQFLHIALGSAAELDTQCIIVQKLGYINEAQLNKISDEIDHVSRMISSLRGKIS